MFLTYHITLPSSAQSKSSFSFVLAKHRSALAEPHPKEMLGRASCWLCAFTPAVQRECLLLSLCFLLMFTYSLFQLRYAIHEFKKTIPFLKSHSCKIDHVKFCNVWVPYNGLTAVWRAAVSTESRKQMIMFWDCFWKKSSISKFNPFIRYEATHSQCSCDNQIATYTCLLILQIEPDSMHGE